MSTHGRIAGFTAHSTEGHPMRLSPAGSRHTARWHVTVAMLALLLAAAGAGRALAQAPATMPGSPPLIGPDEPPEALPVVDVRQIRVQGVTLLDAAVVEKALAGFTGQRTIEELHRAAATVQALYERAGYGAVVAYLPPQEVTGGVVTLEVIEGRLSTVNVKGGTRAFSDAGVLASLPALKTGRTPRLDRVDAQLRMANDNPAKRTRLVLLPGKQPDQTEAEVAVETGARRELALELDNTGSPSTGRARAGVAWRDANASGHDDVLELRAQVAPRHPERFAAAAASYRLPLYEHATMLDAYALASDTQSDRIPTAAGDLMFAGRGYLLGLRATRYVSRLGAFDRRVSLGIERRDQRNQCAIADFPQEACGSAGRDLAVTPLVADFSVAGDARTPIALSAAVVRGLALGGRGSDRAAFEAVRPGARPEFTALRAQFSGRHRLDAGWDAGARFAAQWSFDPLVPAMQFGAGGRDSVRGYEEREVAADHGAALSLDLTTPAWQLAARADTTLRALAFADAATLRNRDDAPCSGTRERCHLAAAGLGLRLAAPWLTAGVDVARTLRSAGTTERGRTRAHIWLRLVR